MSDFDEVLERLVTDPAFQARLAADPRSALAGYRLEPGELELLRSQVAGVDVADRTVEMRTSKSGVVGMIGPVLSAMGAAAAGGVGGGVESLGTAGGHGPFETIGDAPGHHITTSMGNAPHPVESMGHHHAVESIGQAPQPVEDPTYHTRVDADGDGHWDAYKAYSDGHGGEIIEVDMNHDGRVDFIGHDYNRDGIIDSADFDNNFDGTFETRMFDDNGDGWMDRSEPIPPGNSAKEAWGGPPK
jgi:hypothetical protein